MIANQPIQGYKYSYHITCIRGDRSPLMYSEVQRKSNTDVPALKLLQKPTKIHTKNVSQSVMRDIIHFLLDLSQELIIFSCDPPPPPSPAVWQMYVFAMTMLILFALKIIFIIILSQFSVNLTACRMFTSRSSHIILGLLAYKPILICSYHLL